MSSSPLQELSPRRGSVQCPVCQCWNHVPLAICPTCGEPYGMTGRELTGWVLGQGLRAALVGIAIGTLFMAILMLAIAVDRWVL